MMPACDFAPGFRHELQIFRDEQFKYAYVLVLHERETDIVAISMSFDNDIDVFLPFF